MEGLSTTCSMKLLSPFLPTFRGNGGAAVCPPPSLLCYHSLGKAGSVAVSRPCLGPEQQQADPAPHPTIPIKCQGLPPHQGNWGRDSDEGVPAWPHALTT